MKDDGERGRSLLGGEANDVVCMVACVDICETVVVSVLPFMFVEPSLDAVRLYVDAVQDENQDIGADIGAAAILFPLGVG